MRAITVPIKNDRENSDLGAAILAKPVVVVET